MSKRKNFDNNNTLQEHYKVNLIRVMKSGTYRINNHHKLIKAYGKDTIKPALLQKLNQQSIFYRIWFSIFFVLGAVLLILDPSNWLNVFDLFIVMLNIYLVAKRKVIGIYVGLLECIIYGIICFFNGFYGEVINAFVLYTPLYIYEIVSWTVALKKQKKYNHSDSDELLINKLSKKQLWLFAASSLIIFVLSYVLLKFIIKQNHFLT